MYMSLHSYSAHLVLFSELVRTQARDELERVTRERDQLAAQIRQDMGMLDAKVQAAREQGKACRESVVRLLVKIGSSYL